MRGCNAGVMLAMMADTSDTPDTGGARSATATRSLLISVIGAAAFAVLALLWGLAVSSPMIVFDGLYSFVSVLLSLVSVAAVRTIERGADERYPFGRHAWEPLTVILKAVSLATLCGYALIGAIGDILAGGKHPETIPSVLYALVATVGAGLMTRYLRSHSDGLVRAEAAQWLMDTLLSVGVLLGFLLALGLESAGHPDIAGYVDPGMVILFSVLFLRMPVRLFTRSLREVLSISVDPALSGDIETAVNGIVEQYRFDEVFTRVTKIGDQLDVEIDFVVGAHSTAREVTEFDRIRQQISDILETMPHEKWMTVSFTAERRWAH
ncbi:cation diffusion facilitator family transporter [Actinopolyspora lacussalsi]|uniref:Cation diffusion facilitator family transporter n=2 Tax=Actinopolyspora righensis TaxID=995060 RepID=A0A1I6Y2C4_9ACTN|nr:cation diffusion facilitator family transporter [Actinopolyspora lacussalsi]SFT44482.1 cation diffusion facilitator family transporter [Actinopolyspora righensis]